MKKLISVLSVVVVLVFVVVAVSWGYRYELYESAMQYEMSKGSLTKDVHRQPDYQITYLEGPKRQDQDTLLLVHGFAANKENWLRFAAHLSDQYHILAVDLLGHGESTKRHELSYDIDDQVRYIKSFMDAKGIAKFHIAGNSMGGAISAMYSARHPESILSAVLIDPAGIFDHRSELEEHLEQGSNPLIVKDRNDFKRLLSFALEKIPFVPWPLDSVAAEVAMENKEINDRIFQQLRNSSHYDFKAEITNIKAPTLIMWGKQDRVINYLNAEPFNELIPNSEVLLYDDIGHAPMIEIPLRSSHDIHTFIQRGLKANANAGSAEIAQE